nr:MAG TPA: hypothetical protein [Caudoviricetes sp.]
MNPKIEIKAPVSGWHTVSREQAAEIVGFLLHNMQAIPKAERPAYIERERLRGCTVGDLLPALSIETAHAGNFYAYPGGWVLLSRVYRLTEQEAAENALLFLDRWEGIDQAGRTVGAAFSDGATVETSKNWQL